MNFPTGDPESILTILRISNKRVGRSRESLAKSDRLLGRTVVMVRNTRELILRSDKAIQKLKVLGAE